MCRKLKGVGTDTEGVEGTSDQRRFFVIGSSTEWVRTWVNVHTIKILFRPLDTTKLDEDILTESYKYHKHGFT